MLSSGLRYVASLPLPAQLFVLTAFIGVIGVLGTVLGAWLERSGKLQAVDRKAHADRVATRRERQHAACDAFATAAQRFVKQARTALHQAQARLTPEAVAWWREQHLEGWELRVYAETTEMSTAADELADALSKVKNTGPLQALDAALRVDAAVRTLRELARGTTLAPGDDTEPLQQSINAVAENTDAFCAVLRSCCV
ncbi:hypothetical protein ACMZ5E_00185 [Streptomyces rhizosphaericola]|uniref:hypothetical protein n=1 Tax=Streptomyces rhizosphaericola TaxID=2564098 RepID=UPI0039EF6DFE